MPKNVNPMDEEVDFIVDRLIEMVNEIPKDVPPFGSVRLKPEERIQRYAEIRENPQAWLDLLDKHGLKAVVEEATKLEPLYQEWIQEADHERQREAGAPGAPRGSSSDDQDPAQSGAAGHQQREDEDVPLEDS